MVMKCMQASLFVEIRSELRVFSLLVGCYLPGEANSVT